ncbi:MAG: HPF/RaiA family ribosome-associated protein [Proteobacteria bacterium]|nr:HPF/RaiA family ribosome-associated protein [Pseudomonadota bacterium]
MQIPMQIVFHGMEPSEAIERHIRAKAAELEQFHGRITSCRVVVEAPHRHHHKGRLYAVRVDLTVPGGEVVVDRAHPQDHAHEDVRVAVRDAFDAAARRVEDLVRRQRGDVKVHEPPLHGRVARLMPEEGYGFIETADGVEVYFHRNAVRGDRFDELRPGSEVRLALHEGEGEKGPQASTVSVVGKHHMVG